MSVGVGRIFESVSLSVCLFVCLFVCLQHNSTRNSSGDEIAKRDFLHVLASPGYARRTIAVNVTRMERGFNAGQTHRSMYPSIFNCLRAIARYWSEIATFFYPFAFNAPVGSDPLGRSSWFLVSELPDGQATIWCKNITEKLNPLSRVHARHRRQTDRRQTENSQTDFPCH